MARSPEGRVRSCVSKQHVLGLSHAKQDRFSHPQGRGSPLMQRRNLVPNLAGILACLSCDRLEPGKLRLQDIDKLLNISGILLGFLGRTSSFCGRLLNHCRRLLSYCGHLSSCLGRP